MCLVVSIDFSTRTAKRVAEIAEAASRTGPLHVRVAKGNATRRTPRVFLSEPRQGCACSMLTDDADWNASVWDMHEPSRERLAAGIALLARSARGPMTFHALWQGERAAHERTLSVDELVSLVRRGAIETKARYVVS
jgi:hypothetical protein